LGTSRNTRGSDLIGPRLQDRIEGCRVKGVPDEVWQPAARIKREPPLRDLGDELAQDRSAVGAPERPAKFGSAVASR
jgi:hypothetical protein